jgi:hypothetical protein
MVLTVVPKAAEIWAETVPAVNTMVFAVKVPLDCPAGMVMLDGTVTKLLVLDRVTSAPPEGAAMFSVTVPVDGFPLTTVLGFMLTLDTANCVGPHWPGTPPPPHACPGKLVQPQTIVPPQPSGIEPHDGPPEQVAGTQPAFTVSGCVTGVDWPGELALIVTVVVCGTELAA